MNVKNYYAVLGIENLAPLDVVKAAFRKLARQYHPDLNAGNQQAEEKFKEINEAYEILGDPARKGPYDQSLRLLLKVRKPEQARSKSTAPKNTPPAENTASYAKKEKAEPPKPDASRQESSVGDLFESFRRNFQERASTIHQQKATQQAEAKATEPKKEKSTPQDKASQQEKVFHEDKPSRGEDVSVEAVITPLEAEQGVVKTVNVQHKEICRRCTATGRLNGAVCSACQGEKYLSRLKKIDVRIPAGVKQGSKVRISGEGGRGQNGGEAGDLYLLIRVALDESLRIEGLNVYCDLAISIPDAVLGTELEVPTLAGKVKMAIPAMTSSGRVFRLKDQGVQNGLSKGDQFVTVQIVAPENLTPREKELYQELARLQKR